VTVYTSGTYTLTSISSVDTYGYFYPSSFNPSYPSQNLIMSDDDGDGGNQFRMRVNLQYGQTYALVVTTTGNMVTGSFWIRAVGPGSVSMNSYLPSITTSK
jgi:hypothetical protein